MAVEIREVKSRRDLRKFVRFPLKLYRNHPYWVPSLIKDELNSLSPKSNTPNPILNLNLITGYKPSGSILKSACINGGAAL